MKRYMAIDSGKSSTKVAVYDEASDTTGIFKFRTKIGKGNLQDDALEKNTVLMEYDGQVYKIGNGATTEAELDTTKKTMTHKLCTLYAIASICSEDEIDEVNAVIGIPVKDWEDVEQRIAYKNYILPDGDITVKIKKDNDSELVEKTFRIVSKYVYQETLGALFISNNVNTGTVAVIDIGHLNANQTVYNNLEPDKVYSLTNTLGGNALVTGLAQELSSATAEYSLVDEKVAAATLLKEDRCLIPKRAPKGTAPEDAARVIEEMTERSREIIDEYTLNHVKQIRRYCDSKRWSVDFMDFIFIGGTSALLRKEIKEVFGEDAVIPAHPEYANVIGFLRIMCGKVLGRGIPVGEIDE